MDKLPEEYKPLTHSSMIRSLSNMLPVEQGLALSNLNRIWSPTRDSLYSSLCHDRRYQDDRHESWTLKLGVYAGHHCPANQSAFTALRRMAGTGKYEAP